MSLPKIIAGEPVGTLFLAQGRTVAARKRWIGFTVKPRGRLVLDAGPARPSSARAAACWPSAWSRSRGISPRATWSPWPRPDGGEFARGLTNYGDEDLRKIKGLRTGQIAAALGHCPYDEVIHRDNMVITARDEGVTPLTVYGSILY